MKKLLFSFLFASLGMYMTSCQEQGITPSTSTAQANASTDLANIQASAARSAAQTDTSTKHHCKGMLTPIDTTALPAATLTYIHTTYAGASIRMAATDSLGQFVVGIELNKVRTGLLFDATGVFISAMSKDYGKKAALTEIAVSTLPSTITAYITANYTGYTAQKAGTDASGNYFVGITNGTEHKALQFTSAGTFVSALTPPVGGGKGGGKGGH